MNGSDWSCLNDVAWINEGPELDCWICLTNGSDGGGQNDVVLYGV